MAFAASESQDVKMALMSLLLRILRYILINCINLLTPPARQRGFRYKMLVNGQREYDPRVGNVRRKKYEHLKETGEGNGTRQIQGPNGKEEPKRRDSEGE